MAANTNGPNQALAFLQHHTLIDEEELILIITAYNLIKKMNAKRKHRFLVHEIIRRRRQQGAFHNLVQELQFDNENFKLYFRLTKEQFCHVLALVEGDIVKFAMNREAISPTQRLALCLR